MINKSHVEINKIKLVFWMKLNAEMGEEESFHHLNSKQIKIFINK